MREAQIWWSRSPEQPPISTEYDLEAIKVLAASPAILDRYMWLTYRSFEAKGSESISIFGEFGLANQLGCVEYGGRRRFRAMLEQRAGDHS